MNYYIAYKDNNGKDFNGQPWIIPNGGFEELAFAKLVASDFINRGFINVTLFGCNEPLDEEIDWQFVEKNKIIE